MTANGPNRPPLSRRASRQHDETLSRAFGTEDDVLPRGTTDAASHTDSLVAATTDDAEPSTPRRARSTFTTERKRPHAQSRPLPPLEPVVPEIDLTEPASRDRAASEEPHARARVAVTPTREPDAPFATGPLDVADGRTPSEGPASGAIDLVEIPAPVGAPPSAAVDIVVPPRPPLPPADEAGGPGVPDSRPTTRRRRRRPAPADGVADVPVADAEPADVEPVPVDVEPADADPDLVEVEPADVEPADVDAAPAEVETEEAAPVEAEHVPLLRRLRRRLSRSDDGDRPAPEPAADVDGGQAVEPVTESAPDAVDAVETSPAEFPAGPEPDSEPVGESAAADPLPAAPSPARPTRRSSRAAGPASAPTIVQAPIAPAEPDPEPAPTDPAEPLNPLPKHAQTRRSARLGTALGLLVAAVLVMGTAATVTAAVVADPVPEASVSREAARVEEVRARASTPVPLPVAAQSIPAPEVTATAAYVDMCANPDFVAAVAAGDDFAAIDLAGGGEPFRAAVAAGLAPCVPLGNPAHVWAVVNKQRPSDPLDYSPANLAVPAGVRDLAGSPLRVEAGSALAAMVAAAAGAGAGELGLSSGYRSFGVQESTYRSQVEARGAEGADLVSARPGYSEHQSGFAADVVACDANGCGGLDTFAGTPQAAWVAAHAWEFGWVVRYEDGATGVSGYSPEPWHLRYVGTELAAAYHAGGFHTLEEFLGLPAAPHYGD